MLQAIIVNYCLWRQAEARVLECVQTRGMHLALTSPCVHPIHINTLSTLSVSQAIQPFYNATSKALLATNRSTNCVAHTVCYAQSVTGTAHCIELRPALGHRHPVASQQLLSGHWRQHEGHITVYKGHPVPPSAHWPPAAPPSPTYIRFCATSCSPCALGCR